MAPPSKASLRSIADLARFGLVEPARIADLQEVDGRYRVGISAHLAALIEPGNPSDPIGRQFLPDETELAPHPDDRSDPIGDGAHTPLPGLVHRYPDRVLLTPILVCPVYCRFCFRRERVGDPLASLTPGQLDEALAYVADRPAIREVILTGGDPLLLSARRLSDLLMRLSAIPHLELVRIHSRVPVADPARIGPALTRALKTRPGGPALWLAVHVNHVRELAPDTLTALARLADAGVPLLSQTVLLKGVNDSVDALDALFRALVRNRVKPYYLHHPDLAPGTARFRLSLDEGRALMAALRGRLSGIAQPVYVLDIPGGAGKVPVGPDYRDGGQGVVTDPWGGQHPYLA